MKATRLKALLCAAAMAAAAQGLGTGEAFANGMARATLRWPDRSISVGAPSISPLQRAGVVRARLDVALTNTGRRSLPVSASDFVLSSQGDIFGVQAWDARPGPVALAPHHSRMFRLTFMAPAGAVAQATLSYRPLASRISGTVALHPPSNPTGSTSTPAPTINTFYVTQGVGEPWGTAIDKAGNVWFAEPGCDFAPTCGAGTPPGQIGEIQAGSHGVVLYTLPNIAGNQPIFVAFDGAGNLWFTTPDNSEIGEFSPSTGKFIGQWAVTAGSGPWDLTFVERRIWYTEHLVSSVGVFNPLTHAHRDFRTPSPNSNPYGIAANKSSVWFTENNSNVDRVAVLNSITDAISEYPIVLPLSGTPHMITVGANGQPWWTEGWSSTIATLNPAVARAGQCGTTSGTCNGIHRYLQPVSTTCSTSSHTSGIAFQSSANVVWLDNSLTAQVGSFNPSTSTFALNTLGNCNAHPLDGLNLDAAQNVWFDEEFGSAIGELIP